MHYSKTGLFKIGYDNQVIISGSPLAIAGYDHRVIPNSSTPNSANYPTIKRYLELEAQDDHVLIHMDNSCIITDESSSDPILNGLEAYWTMSEATGTRTDSVASIQLQELDGATPSVAGKIGTAADLTAARRLYIAGNADDFLKPVDSPFSLATWVYPTAALVRPVLGYRPYTPSNGGVGWFITWNGSLNRFYFSYSGTAMATPGTSIVDIQKAGGLLNDWNLIIVTFDGTDISVYVNNQAPAVQAIFGGGDFYQSSADFIVGGYTDRVDLSYRWDGYIDNFGWWSRVLTADEINSLWNNGNGVELY